MQKSDLKNIIRKQMFTKLESEWNHLHSEMELRDSSERDEEAEFHANMVNMVKKEVIEELLSELSTRMASPGERLIYLYELLDVSQSEYRSEYRDW